MSSIGIYEAKNRLSELIEQVRTTGEAITITNRGQPVVDLTPTRAGQPEGMTKAEALEAVAQLWKELPRSEPGENRRIIEEGRDRWPAS